MRLVVDANILFALCIVEGTTAQLFSKIEELYTPAFSIEEVEKHIDELRAKTHRENLNGYLDALRENLIIVPLAEILPYIKEVIDTAPDPMDIPYLALAKKLNCPLWSQDKALRKQSVVKVMTTEELTTLLASSEYQARPSP